jgi:hypothetical protein
MAGKVPPYGQERGPVYGIVNGCSHPPYEPANGNCREDSRKHAEKHAMGCKWTRFVVLLKEWHNTAVMNGDEILERRLVDGGKEYLLTKADYDELRRRIIGRPDLTDRLITYVLELDAFKAGGGRITAQNNDDWIFPLHVEFRDLLSDRPKMQATWIPSLATRRLMDDIRSGDFFQIDE